MKCSGKVLDAYHSSIVSGQNVIQYAWDGGTYQQWKFVDAGNGYYYISPRCNERLCLDVYSAESTNGTNVQVYTANQTAAQKWQLAIVSTSQGSAQSASGHWGEWSPWQTDAVSETSTREVETKEEQASAEYTEYRYGGYIGYDSRGVQHQNWCETYIRKLYGNATLRYSEWSTTRYSNNPCDWTCGYCRGEHTHIDHYANGKPYWHQYTLPDGDYYWEESRTVGGETRTLYRYRDWISN